MSLCGDAINRDLLQRYAAVADGPAEALAALRQEVTALRARATPAAATDPAAAEVCHTCQAVAELAAERRRELDAESEFPGP